MSLNSWSLFKKSLETFSSNVDNLIYPTLSLTISPDTDDVFICSLVTSKSIGSLFLKTVTLTEVLSVPFIIETALSLSPAISSSSTYAIISPAWIPTFSAGLPSITEDTTTFSSCTDIYTPIPLNSPELDSIYLSNSSVVM